MKIFVIRNEEDKTRKNLAYLIYYEKDKRFEMGEEYPPT